ncbi:MAG: transglutaminase domain-containing protein [Candidatus Thorarchaeota archaeon]
MKLIPINQIEQNIQSQKLSSTGIDIIPLLPKPKNSYTIWDSFLPGTSPYGDLFKILSDIVSTKLAMIQLNNSVSTDPDSGDNYEVYLQFPNDRIKALVSTIVNPSDSDDTKMYKIEQWVINNINYISDTEQYKTSELWAYPTMTITSKKGDCEDGAFLIHSMALNAGVDPDRLRTYGGIVVTGDGTGVGGHAWTSYKRELDDEWVIMDWCYWPTDISIYDREPMSENIKYIDDYFFVTQTKTVETPYSNRVRFAINPVGSTTQPMAFSVIA